jgi:hypothetical protein
VRKRDFILAGTIAIAGLTTAFGAQAQTFRAMNREVEGFLTGLWVRTTAPSDRPPNTDEVTAGLTRCDESMIDPKADEQGMRSVFPNEGATHGDISMFRSADAFVLAERTQTAAGLKSSTLRKMTVGATQQQNRIVVRFVSSGQWADGGWQDRASAPAVWGDALLGDLDVGGNTEHVLVLGKDNMQLTYVKCGS